MISTKESQPHPFLGAGLTDKYAGRNGHQGQSMTVSVSTGGDAWALLKDPQFRSDWNALMELCPWATVFQSVHFVTTWYEAYASAYSPVVVWERDEGQRLTGLLT